MGLNTGIERIRLQAGPGNKVICTCYAGQASDCTLAFKTQQGLLETGGNQQVGPEKGQGPLGNTTPKLQCWQLPRRIRQNKHFSLSFS